MGNTDQVFSEGSIWVKPGTVLCIQVIDQRFLPFRQEVFEIRTVEEAWFAIREMVVRGAPLIGVTAAYGMVLSSYASRNNDRISALRAAAGYLNRSRPTAVNLVHATSRMLRIAEENKERQDLPDILHEEACRMRREEIDSCLKIGEHGWPLIEAVSKRNEGKRVQILTHCNAGWLACVKYGTATAPIYLAHERGIPVHVWVDETRPRNQGARLTAYELGLAGVPHTVIPDNSGGHLMQHGMVDLVLVGSDYTTINGDVANKTGTYLKALAACDNKIPFFVALPSSSIGWDQEDGLKNIPIEERSPEEVESIEGWNGKEIVKVRLIPENSRAANWGFDVTPARLVTGLITERGICAAGREGLMGLFPENNPGINAGIKTDSLKVWISDI